MPKEINAPKILFKGSGSLDIATGAPQLPDNGLQRAKNVSLETRGHITLRRGSQKLNSNRAFEEIDFLIEQGGNRYMFAADGNIYRNEQTIPRIYGELFDSDGKELFDSDGEKLLVIED